MARTSDITDEALKTYLEAGFTPEYIGKATGLSKRQVYRRMNAMERPAASRQAQVVEQVRAPLWDIKHALEDVHTRLYAELDNSDNALPVLAEIRRTIETAHKVLESLYTIQAQTEFEDAVLGVLNECEPTLRNEVLRRVREARTIRTAFVPRS